MEDVLASERTLLHKKAEMNHRIFCDIDPLMSFEVSSVLSLEHITTLNPQYKTWNFLIRKRNVGDRGKFWGVSVTERFPVSYP